VTIVELPLVRRRADRRDDPASLPSKQLTFESV